MDRHQLSLSGMSSSGLFFFQIKVEGRKGNYVVLNDVLGSVVVKYAATVSERKY